jgi:methylmalonyl-CoA mutase cobalamin-binding domain/chain
MILALACRQAGMEVILAGFKQTAAQLVEAAMQEDAEILGVSSMAGAHLTIARETLDLLKQNGANNIGLVMGGIIPDGDRERLIEMGVKAVFTPRDSSLGKIVEKLLAVSNA